MTYDLAVEVLSGVCGWMNEYCDWRQWQAQLERARARNGSAKRIKALERHVRICERSMADIEAGFPRCVPAVEVFLAAMAAKSK